MAHKPLDGVRVAILAADGYERVELTRPRKALRRAGATVEVVSLRPGWIRGINFMYPGRKVHVHRTVFTAREEDYGALLVPGGFINPDLLRQSEHARAFVAAFEKSGKPIASLCHGPWVLASAGLVRGRRMTSWPGIADDLRNAGAAWESAPLVRDGNWVTSRGPQDLAAFERGMIALFDERAPRQRARMRARQRLQDLLAAARALPATVRRLTEA